MERPPEGSRFQSTPYWLVIAELADEDQTYAMAAVGAPTEEDANAEGQRTIAGNEGTDAFDVKYVRGPFPQSPGEAAPAVRPDRCRGCGLHCWEGERPPYPHSTWFTRDEETDDAIAWQCIQCETRTRIPKDTVS